MLYKPYQFKPAEHQAYWYVDVDGRANQTLFQKTIFDYQNYALGNTFEHREDITPADYIGIPMKIMHEYAKGEE